MAKPSSHRWMLRLKGRNMRVAPPPIPEGRQWHLDGRIGDSLAQGAMAGLLPHRCSPDVPRGPWRSQPARAHSARRRAVRFRPVAARMRCVGSGSYALGEKVVHGPKLTSTDFGVSTSSVHTLPLAPAQSPLHVTL